MTYTTVQPHPIRYRSPGKSLVVSGGIVVPVVVGEKEKVGEDEEPASQGKEVGGQPRRVELREREN